MHFKGYLCVIKKKKNKTMNRGQIRLDKGKSSNKLASTGDN